MAWSSSTAIIVWLCSSGIENYYKLKSAVLKHEVKTETEK